MATGTTVPYATRRFNEHIVRFTRLYEDLIKARWTSPTWPALKHKTTSSRTSTTASTPPRRGGSRPSSVHRSQPGIERNPRYAGVEPADRTAASEAPSSSAQEPSKAWAPDDAAGTPATGAADNRARRRSAGDFSIVPPPPAKAPLRVLFVASEVAPFRKTGGLADVAGALPRALARRGIDVRVVMPLYGAFAGTSWNAWKAPCPFQCTPA